MSEPLLWERHGAVALLRLNRPEALNALNLALRRALATAFLRIDADPQVRAVVLAGGARAFCAGADLGEYVDATPAVVASRRLGALWQPIADCRVPVIAAVRGHALGGGCELVQHADLVVASETARFGQPEVLIGLMPGGGGTQRLVQAVGKVRAMGLLMLGEPVDAREALAIGLVNAVVPDDDTEAHALALAQRLARGPRHALSAIKASVLHGLGRPLPQGLAHERQAFQRLFETADKTEGIRARMAKRPARFDAH